MAELWIQNRLIAKYQRITASVKVFKSYAMDFTIKRNLLQPPKIDSIQHPALHEIRNKLSHDQMNVRQSHWSRWMQTNKTDSEILVPVTAHQRQLFKQLNISEASRNNWEKYKILATEGKIRYQNSENLKRAGLETSATGGAEGKYIGYLPYWW